jgi:anti-sigma regulatory factor (Ser/Thr protein kinase)
VDGAPIAVPQTVSIDRQLSLPADLSRLLEARRFAEQVASDFGFDPALQAQIKLAANEAVANAMEHGSPTPEHPVELRAVEEDEGLAFYIADKGGFVELERARRGGGSPERGRGLAFMDLLMDEVEVRPGSPGTEVRMFKRLAA